MFFSWQYLFKWVNRWFIMVMKTKTCRDCKKEFEQDSHARFQRKYCVKCSAERKKAYENIHEVSIEDCED